MNSPWKYHFLVAAGSALLFIPFLGRVPLFDWDELNFAEAAREMIITGDYFRVHINYERFWEKPPLFIWLQALSMKFFGVNEFAARLPNAITGIATMSVLFRIGAAQRGFRFGLLWCLAFAGSLLPHFYFKSGIIDPLFNLFIFLAVFHLSSASGAAAWKQILLSGLYSGLAVLTKGPAAVVILLICVLGYLITTRSRPFISASRMAAWALIILAVSGAWYGTDLASNGIWFMKEFIAYQWRLLTTSDAGHGGPFYYHGVVLLLGCFPASIFFLPSLFRADSGEELRRWLRILFWVVLILFSLAGTKIVHYSSLCYFPITYLAADQLSGADTERRFSRWLAGLTGILGGLISSVLIALPLAGRNPSLILPFIKDPFAAANLEASPGWSNEWLIGVIFLVAVVLTAFMLRKRTVPAAVTLFIASGITVQLVMLTMVPKVERHTQGAAIDFYKSLAGKDCYVDVLGYKSYAHLFYTRKPEPVNKESLNAEWLLRGPVDKQVYFVARIDRLKGDEASMGLIETGRGNGFVFFVRHPTADE